MSLSAGQGMMVHDREYYPMFVGLVHVAPLILSAGQRMMVHDRECYPMFVGLVHAAPPTQYKAFGFFGY